MQLVELEQRLGDSIAMCARLEVERDQRAQAQGVLEAKLADAQARADQALGLAAEAEAALAAAASMGTPVRGGGRGGGGGGGGDGGPGDGPGGLTYDMILGQLDALRQRVVDIELEKEELEAENVALRARHHHQRGDPGTPVGAVVVSPTSGGALPATDPLLLLGDLVESLGATALPPGVDPAVVDEAEEAMHRLLSAFHAVGAFEEDGGALAPDALQRFMREWRLARLSRAALVEELSAASAREEATHAMLTHALDTRSQIQAELEGLSGKHLSTPGEPADRGMALDRALAENTRLVAALEAAEERLQAIATRFGAVEGGWLSVHDIRAVLQAGRLAYGLTEETAAALEAELSAMLQDVVASTLARSPVRHLAGSGDLLRRASASPDRHQRSVRRRLVDSVGSFEDDEPNPDSAAALASPSILVSQLQSRRSARSTPPMSGARVQRETPKRASAWR